MVDYTTKPSGGGAVGLYIAAGAVVLVLLWAIFAGGGGTPTIDPSVTGATEPAAVETVDPATLGTTEPATTAPAATD